MSAVNSMRTIFQRFGFSEAAATYLTGTCEIDSLDEIPYLDGIEGTSRVTSRNNGIPVSIRAVANLKLCVYYLKHMERVQRKPIPNAINLVLVRSYWD
jgi:hypothetical protein